MKTKSWSLFLLQILLFAFVTVHPVYADITMGETAILTSADNGNGNLLVAQSAVLSQTATIQSLSFYVTTAAGNLRLGIYDATGPSGGPGAKKAETNSFTPVTGWNTANVTAPVSLSAGTYWLAYLPSDNNLAFVKNSDASSSGKYYTFTYGPMPATFSTTPNTTPSHWSFYATLTVPVVNLLSNPGFESGTTGWNLPSSASITTTSGEMHTGSKALKMTAGAWAWATQSQPASAGVSYNVSGWIKTQDATKGALLRVDFQDSANNTLVINKLPLVKGTTAYQQYSASFTAPVGTTKVLVACVRPAGTVGLAWFDDLSLSVNSSDITAPTVSMTAPANNATISGAVVNVSANASDNVGVVGVQFKLDGNNLGAEDTTSPYSVYLDSTALTNASHTLRAVARDAAGNTTTSTTVNITVNNPPPPPSPDTIAPSVPGNLSATAVSSSQINLSWSASTDNVGVTGYRVERCQGSSCTTFSQISTPSGTTYNDTTGLTANTTYRYRVRATDAALNLSTYSSIVNGTTQAVTSGNVYYVAKTGTDSNSCTSAKNQSTPKLTIAAGVACMVGGDTLYIKAGTYAEGNQTITPPAGNLSNYTVISRFGTDIVNLICQPFRLFNSSAAFLTLDGFILDGNTCGGSSNIAIGQGPHHIRLYNLEVKNNSAIAISVGNDDNSGTGNVEIVGCKVHNNGATAYDNAIYVSGSSNNLIERCEIYNNLGDAIQIWSVGPSADNNIIRLNKVHDLTDQNGTKIQGIVVGQGNNNQVYNNIVYRIKSSVSGLCCGGIQITLNAANTKVYNNTVYDIDSQGIYIESFAGSGNIVRNNISYQNSEGNIINEGSGSVLSNNLTVNPTFVNAAGDDFHLQSTSPAINTGATLGSPYNVDFDGISRPQGSAYDIGAYEYR